MLIAEAGGIPLLVALLSDEDVDVKSGAVRVLGSLAENDDNNELIGEAGAIVPLVTLLRDENAKVKRNAACALENLAENDDNSVSIVEAGAIVPLLELLNHGDDNVAVNVASALGCLARNHNNGERIAETGVIDRLVNLLCDEDAAVKSKAVHALKCLACNDDNRRRIGEAGAIPHLVKLLRDEGIVVETKVADVLRNLALNHDNKRRIGEAGAIPLLVKLLNECHSGHISSGTSATKIANATLRTLVDNDDNRRRVVEAGAIVQLVKFLSDRYTDAGVKSNAAHVLWSLALNHDYRAHIAKAGGMWLAEFFIDESFKDQAFSVEEAEIIVQLLSDWGNFAKKRAVCALSTLAKNDDNRRLIAEAGAIIPLVALLRDEDIDVKAGAVHALAKLALNDDNQTLIAQAGGIVPLLNLLTDNYRVSYGALSALANLAVNAENQASIVHLDNVVPLVKHLTHGFTMVREEAARALANLTVKAENQVSIAQAGAIPPLVGLLIDNNSDVRYEAARTLANLVLDDENKVRIAKEGAIVPWAYSMSDKDYVDSNAACELVKLAFNEGNQERIVQANAISLLVGLLTDNDGEVRCEAVRALANLALNDDNQVLMAQAGAIEPLVQLFDQGDGNALVEASIALTWLSQNSDNQQALLDRGILDRWQSLSSEISSWESNEKIQYFLGLLTLSSGQEYKTMLLESGVLDELLAYLEDEDWYPWAGLVVAKLLGRLVENNPQAYTLINSDQLAPVMDNLLARKDLQIRRLMDETLRAGSIPPEEVQRGVKVGSGASCSVYQGTFNDQAVAIKCFEITSRTAGRRECIEREIRLMSRLRHPRLVHLFGIVRIEYALPWLVMELAKQSLRNYLQQNNHREITWQQRLRWACELSDGLTFLHQKGVVHRDIKSLNVLIDDQLRLKWCDFGISREKEDVSVATQLETIDSQEQGRQHPGTIRWMAPELLRPQRQADGSVRDLRQPSTKSDIWALGMVFFELIEGQLPWHEFVGAEIIAAIIDPDCKGEVVPTVCRTASPGFAAIMQRCWKERDERPTAATIFQELTELDPPVEPSSRFYLGRGFSS